MKNLKGKDVLPHVRNRKPKLDAEHRVPTGARPHTRGDCYATSQVAGRIRGERTYQVFACEEPHWGAADTTAPQRFSSRLTRFSLAHFILEAGSVLRTRSDLRPKDFLPRLHIPSRIQMEMKCRKNAHLPLTPVTLSRLERLAKGRVRGWPNVSCWLQFGIRPLVI